MVAALAADLNAYLEGHAISGGTRTYQLRKFVRRHWLPLAAAATILLILLGSGAAIVWQAHQTEREAGKTAAVKDFLLEPFRNANPNVAQGRQITCAIWSIVVCSASTRFRRPGGTKAELQNTLGTIYYQLGLFNEAIALHEQAFVAVKSRPDATCSQQRRTHAGDGGGVARRQCARASAGGRRRAARARAGANARARSGAGVIDSWLDRKNARIWRVPDN